jgi:hypothetical protein
MAMAGHSIGDHARGGGAGGLWTGALSPSILMVLTNWSLNQRCILALSSPWETPA